jgi:hypothetical protein
MRIGKDGVRASEGMKRCPKGWDPAAIGGNDYLAFRDAGNRRNDGEDLPLQGMIGQVVGCGGPAAVPAGSQHPGVLAGAFALDLRWRVYLKRNLCLLRLVHWGREAAT